VPPKDDDETPVTDDQLRRLVDAMPGRRRRIRTRVSDDEEAASIVNMRDLTFPRQTQRRHTNDADAALDAIRRNAQRVDAQQKRNDDFWKRNNFGVR
jgi:hypothetical protein